MNRIIIETPRLQLLGADSTVLRADLAGRADLAQVLGAVVPASWPPEFLDEAATRWALAAAEEMPADSMWRMYYMLLRHPEAIAIGTCGFKFPPDARGCVEVGYSVLPAFQRQGLATEAVFALMDVAARHGAREVCAQTLPDLTASLRVMEKSGMVLTGAGSEPGAIRGAVKLQPR